MAYQPPPQPKKNSNPPPVKKDNLKKDQGCHYCNVVGHWKRNCPIYLDELRANRIKKVGHVSANTSARQASKVYKSSINSHFQTITNPRDAL
ncbi:hypothetical protein CTI12_AA322290 [Artemisia annua]|uniref:CCHC-type domain-containing protein n=1 Tax=Artemisia annua TaxID=35608 RepID=A0A2U1MWD3_ARTAN|nr:hypothetical protein CTI12_AA322290 [Artemisia annua]